MKLFRDFAIFCVAVTTAMALSGVPLRAESAAPKHNAQPANPIEAITNGLKFRTEPGEPADFVRSSRKPEGELQYVPIGGARAEPNGSVLKADEIKAREAELDTLRARHGRIAHRPADKVAFRSAAGVPKPPKAKKQQKCLITCTVQLKGERK